ncbi:hypothetical protein GCM10012286_03110 [Streptomyces lasiicapitis]|uniref:Uncharacterized protein n=1 Tax=Streptomyces lasiicapitis TaxID=1923961 RepID=A0ABQ2LHH4_9ACTN|nr:hypothetical protein GCM10012286_03110 [Streptomyces lasiicapitis]
MRCPLPRGFRELVGAECLRTGRPLTRWLSRRRLGVGCLRMGCARMLRLGMGCPPTRWLSRQRLGAGCLVMRVFSRVCPRTWCPRLGRILKTRCPVVAWLRVECLAM